MEVTGEFIGLGQLLQLAGVVDTGGEAKNLIGTLTVAVNGEPEGRRGRKLRPGDVVEVPDAESLRVVSSPPERYACSTTRSTRRSGRNQTMATTTKRAIDSHGTNGEIASAAT